MRWASPSTMAVLPTPGSPISTGLFLLRRCSTWMARRISSSRPITGSSLPWRARSVRSSVYFFSASRWLSPSALSMVWPPRTASMAASRPCGTGRAPWRCGRPRPWRRPGPAGTSRWAMNWSPRLMLSFSVACSSLPRSGPGCTCSWPCTCGQALDGGLRRPGPACRHVDARRAPAARAGRRFLAQHGRQQVQRARCRRGRCPAPAIWASERASWNLVVSLSRRMVVKIS
jgi:hypothetical protein